MQCIRWAGPSFIKGSFRQGRANVAAHRIHLYSQTWFFVFATRWLSSLLSFVRPAGYHLAPPHPLLSPPALNHHHSSNPDIDSLLMAPAGSSKHAVQEALDANRFVVQPSSGRGSFDRFPSVCDTPTNHWQPFFHSTYAQCSLVDIADVVKCRRRIVYERPSDCECTVRTSGCLHSSMSSPLKMKQYPESDIKKHALVLLAKVRTFLATGIGPPQERCCHCLQMRRLPFRLKPLTHHVTRE